MEMLKTVGAVYIYIYIVISSLITILLLYKKRDLENIALNVSNIF